MLEPTNYETDYRITIVSSAAEQLCHGGQM